jgi:Na+-transporting methylmalonyl-CoA/oxaloacetate decarboxylase gamma subunit
LNTNNFIEGANLLTTGMVTVFIFLGVLILAINLIKLLFSERVETISPSSIPNDNEIPNDHKKIIKAIGLRINE